MSNLAGRRDALAPIVAAPADCLLFIETGAETTGALSTVTIAAAGAAGRGVGTAPISTVSSRSSPASET